MTEINPHSNILPTMGLECKDTFRPFDGVTKEIVISLSNQQEGARSDRLMATVTTTEEENIDLDYPEKSLDRLGSMRWKNILKTAAYVTASLITMLEGYNLVQSSLPENIGGVVVGGVVGVVGFCYVANSIEGGLEQGETVSYIKNLIKSKIKTGLGNQFK